MQIAVCKLCGRAPQVVGREPPLPEDGYGIVCRLSGDGGKLGHYVEVVSNIPSEAVAEWNRLNG